MNKIMGSVKMINETAIKNRLVEHGKKLFNAPKKLHQFTKIEEADLLLNDLNGNPHAFVLACIMDRQIKAERAWLIPYKFMEKLGDFSMKTLCSLSLADIHNLMFKPEPLHRFVDSMAHFFHSGINRISSNYNGDASKIWSRNPSSATVIYRFLEFDGVGPKIASMAANILARDFKIPFSDYFSIDISADIHVRRVFGRLGLTSTDATIEQLIYRARSLHPEFPGLMDLAAWEIGRNWCRPKKANCQSCFMNDLCVCAKSGPKFDLTKS